MIVGVFFFFFFFTNLLKQCSEEGGFSNWATDFCAKKWGASYLRVRLMRCWSRHRRMFFCPLRIGLVRGPAKTAANLSTQNCKTCDETDVSDVAVGRADQSFVLASPKEQHIAKRSCSNACSISSRTGDVVEPLLKDQWFVDCTQMAKDASEVSRRLSTRRKKNHSECRKSSFLPSFRWSLKENSSCCLMYLRNNGLNGWVIPRQGNEWCLQTSFMKGTFARFYSFVSGVGNVRICLVFPQCLVHIQTAVVGTQGARVQNSSARKRQWQECLGRC